MADDRELVNLAASLGQALAAHPKVRAYYEAQRAVRTDSAAQALLQEYQAHMDRLHQLEHANMPVEVEDKRKLRELETRVAGQDALKQLMRTQTDYAALMAQVNQAIDGPLAALARPEKSA